MDIVRADGSTGSMGSSTVETPGRTRELQQGRDAVIRVDGAEFVRQTNNITDAIPNVTLSLTAAEIGTTVDLDIARDVDGASDAAKALVDVYNEVRTFFDEQRQVDAPLYGNSLFRGVVDSFTAALRTDVTDNATYTKPTLVGMVLDRNGKLTYDAAKFKEALNAAPKEIEALFGFGGLGGAFVTATDRAGSIGTGTIPTQLLTIDESTTSLRVREADARRRLDARRAALVTQFTQMEAALSRLNSQGTALAGLTASLQTSRG
jgi:flagellar hook-associated protein 2